MIEFLLNLVERDCKLAGFKSDKQIILNGLAPLFVEYKHSNSVNLIKASLLEKAKFQNWQEKSQTIFKLFDNSGIRFLVFKGFALTHCVYQNSYIRPYSDIDMIVDVEDYKMAEQLLSENGFSKVSSREGQFVSFQNSFYDNDSPQCVIDLHWQINNRIEFHKNFPFGYLYKHSNTINQDDSQFHVLSSVDGFVLSCFHFQAHRPEDRKHIWLYDLALMWNQMSDVEKQTCIEKAKATSQYKVVSSCLHLVNQVFGKLYNLDGFIVENNFEDTELYLGERKRKATDIKIRLKNIDGFSNKIKYLSEYIFQSRDYVKNRYQLKTTNWIWLYYPRMWVEDFLKLFK